MAVSLRPVSRGMRLVLAAALMVSVAACGGSPQSPGSASPTPSATVDPVLGQRATAVVAALVAEDFDAAVAYFDETMRQELPATTLAATWRQVTQQVGAYESELARRQEATGQYRAVIVTARFEQSPLDIRVVFDSARRVAGLFFQPARGPTSAATPAAWQPPAYADLNRVSDVAVTIGDGTWQLPGTVTTPAVGGPWPAVVLVHGSGPNDRDETIGPNKPFRDLALGLASRGVAVLAYDKRSLTHGAALAAVADLTVAQEVVDDAVLAVQRLRDTPGVDRDRVFLLGHSLGGMLAPRIAHESDGLAGLVIMAGAARPLEDHALEQTTYLAERDGTVTAQERGALDQVADQVARIKDPGLDARTPPAALLGVPASYWLDLRGYQPAAAAAGLDLPLLVLQGERDYQVTMADFAVWQRALAARADARLISFPGLNHLMMTAPALAPSAATTAAARAGAADLGGPEEYQVAGHVAPEVIDAIATFLLG